ncbi:MAG: hypothetical protein PVI30_13285 [Myxococcales bacterium]|jgi:(2Fe-2S) ferredoxin
MASSYQLVFCVGPRCCHRGEPDTLMEHARVTIRADARLRGRVHLGTFECLARCPAGPNLVVRRLPDDSDDPGEPGMRDLTGLHYWGVDRGLLERILREHCGDDTPLPDRHQRY